MRKTKRNKAGPLPPPSDAPDRFYSKQEVLAVVGVSYPSLWSWMRDDLFPKSRVLGTGHGVRTKIAWLKSEVDEWVQSRPQRVPKGSK